MRRSLSLAGVLSLVLAAHAPAVTAAHDPVAASLERSDQPTAPMSETVPNKYARIPLTFVPNHGQADPTVRFQARGAGFGFAFGDTGVTIALRRGDRGAAVQLAFVEATSVEPSGERTATGTVSYFIGDDPALWRSGLPTYEAVRYREPWPGVDLVFQGAPGRLKYEFVIAPGTSVSAIKLAYVGAESLALAPDGGLVVSTTAGVLHDESPVSYQIVEGERLAVESRFAIGDESTYGFIVGAHDADRELVIDPGLVYSTFLGGVNGDVGNGIAVDSGGNAYVTGGTPSANFPVGPGFDTTFNSGSDVFVTKLNASGTALVYSTFIGGSSEDQGLAIAVDSLGSAYVTGSTGSTNYPRQQADPAGLYQSFYGGGSTDAFVTKLSPTGTALVFSTYAGGIGADQGFGIAVHPSTDVYVTGDTTSSSFVRGFTTNALQKTRRGSMDAFFLRLDRFAAAAGYMSYLGGSSTDSARAIAVDGARNVYLTGGTSSSDYPTTGGSFDTSYGGTEDVFVTKLRYDGSTSGPGDTYALGYSTFLGGGALDRGLGIALDSGGNAYVSCTRPTSVAPATTGARASRSMPQASQRSPDARPPRTSRPRPAPSM